MKNINRNLTMLCDYYELTMSNGYFVNGMKDKIVYFDVFYRDNPDNGGYAIVAGLEQIIEYIKDLCFDSEDIEYLRKRGCFSEEFLSYLSSFALRSFLISSGEKTYSLPQKWQLTAVSLPSSAIAFSSSFPMLMITLSVRSRLQSHLYSGEAVSRTLGSSPSSSIFATSNPLL